MTTGAVLIIYAVAMGTAPFRQRLQNTVPPDDGTVTFDLCYMVPQVPVMVKLTALVCGPSILALFIPGLRNRVVPGWVAVGGLMSLVVTLWYDQWRIEHWWTTFSFVSLGTIVLMCVHQLLPRRDIISD